MPRLLLRNYAKNPNPLLTILRKKKNPAERILSTGNGIYNVTEISPDSLVSLNVLVPPSKEAL